MLNDKCILEISKIITKHKLTTNDLYNLINYLNRRYLDAKIEEKIINYNYVQQNLSSKGSNVQF